MGIPSTNIFPPLGCKSPKIISINVDFPAPVSPIIAIDVFGFKSKLIFSNII
jgi:hypothetical protein